MLPSMPILLTASQGPPESDEGILNQGSKDEIKSDDGEKGGKDPKQGAKPVRAPSQDGTFEIIPEEDCDDELVLLADNSPLCEKRRLSQTTTSKKKKRVELNFQFETNLEVKILDDLSEQYAEVFMNKVKSTVDEDTFSKFIVALSEITDDSGNAVRLYHQMEEILLDHSDLVDDFVGFLKPCQALECGRLTDLKYIANCLAYFKKLEGHQGTRLLHAIETHVASQTATNLESLKASIIPILKGNSHLLETFLPLLPEERPPVPSSKDDYEEITETSTDDGDWERITIPEHAERGCSPNCTCRCHSTPSQPFCVACNIRFINGQAFVQYGKIWRYARLNFGDAPHHEMLSNLHPDLYSIRRKKRKTSVSKASNPLNKELPGKEENAVSSKEDAPQFLSPDLDRNDKNEEDDDYWEDENSSDKSSAGELLDISNEDTHEDGLEDTQDSTRFMVQISKPLSPIESLFGEDVREEAEMKVEEKKESEDDQECFEIPAQSSDNSQMNVKVESEKDEEKHESSESRGWTRQEDKMILQAFQKDFGTEQIFSKISNLMPSRSVTDIQKRFQVLMNLLEKVASGSHETYPV